MTSSSPEYLTTEEAARHLALSCSLLNKLRCRGGGPEFSKLAGTVRYRRDALDAWAAAHTRRSTSEYQREGAAA